MSGLATLFFRDGRPGDEASVRSMLAAAPYRGPDGQWVRQWGSVTLGYLKMAITPEERDEVQPLLSPRTGCAIIADVRLDNREELFDRLPDQPPRNASDTDLILRAYETWEMDVAAHLLGDFAFVIWDPRRQSVVAARDTQGQRPLFYRIDPRTFAAASEIQQLFQDPAVPIAPNEERIRDFLVPFNTYRNVADQAATFYEGILALPAGQILIVGPARHRAQRYWEFPHLTEIRYRHDEEYADHYRELFFEVVRARLRSTRPMAALLSGGLDSASIVCVAQELDRAGKANNPGFTSFSSVFDGLECDETSFIRDVQLKYGMDARYIPAVGVVESLQLAPRTFMPSPGKATNELDEVFRTASQDKIRVMLSGDVADACTFGSRHVFDSLLRQAHLGQLWRHLQAYRRVSDESWRKILAVYCVAPLLPLRLQKLVMASNTRRAFRRLHPYLLPTWIPEGLRRDLARRHLALALEAERARRFSSPARHEEYNLLYPPEVSYNTAPWPLQVWRPFTDRRLQEFLLSIPPEQKFEPHPYADDLYAGSKLIVRRALRGVLPESIRTRTVKTHFASLFEDEVKRQWPSYEAAFGLAGRSEVVARGYVDQPAFWARLNHLREGDWGNDFMYITHVMWLETWLRTFQLPRTCLVSAPSERARSNPSTIARDHEISRAELT